MGKRLNQPEKGKMMKAWTNKRRSKGCRPRL
jgi:hypothetical protein